MPTMTHPGSKQTLEVVPEQVPMYESQGWSAKPSPKKRAAKKTATTKRSEA